MPFLTVIVIAFVIGIIASIKIIQEYERGVVYTLGRYTGTRGAGVQLIVPVFQRVLFVDMRIRTEDIPPQDVISKDNVSVKVN
ncbi:MAG: slipin family protein, partial [Alphaproteobacteria bacterium]|nr:slipin family protein [Alphaproteobacteria bacterium]